MAATSLGLVGIVDKGDYNSATTYVKGNFVYYNYCSWLCKVASATGIEPTEQNNTTWQLLAKGINLATFTGATASTAGTGGAVPAPQAGDEGKALMGDGTWNYAGELSWTGTQAQWNALSASKKAEYDGKKVYITDDYMENIPVMVGASANDGGYKGLVPTPNAGDEGKFLRGDGNYADVLIDSGWLVANGTNNNSVHYRKIGAFVNIRRGATGIVALNTDVVIGVLPEGYRPPDIINKALRSDSSTITKMTIRTNGNVEINTTANANYIPAFNEIFTV